MNAIKIDRPILDALEADDYESGLKLAIENYHNIQDGESKDRMIMLRLISGAAQMILKKEIGDEPNKNLYDEFKCGFCSRDVEDTELTQGHGGRICNSCVNMIYDKITTRE